MDYSLLVGIHDCSIPPIPEDESLAEGYDEDGNGYVSSDDINDPTLSPTAGENAGYKCVMDMHRTIRWCCYTYKHFDVIKELKYDVTFKSTITLRGWFICI